MNDGKWKRDGDGKKELNLLRYYGLKPVKLTDKSEISLIMGF